MSREADRQVLVREAKLHAGGIERERRATSLGQQSREKIIFYRQVYKDKLGDRRCMLRRKTRELEDFEELQVTQVQEIKQRLKQLCHDFTQESGALKMASEKDRTRQREEHQSKEVDLRHDQNALERKRKGDEAEHAAFLVELLRSHNEDKHLLKTDSERRSHEITSIFKVEVEALRTSAGDVREDQLKSVHVRNQQRVASLLTKHQMEIANLKGYFSDIIPGNLDTIMTLKREMGDLSSQEDHAQRQITSLAHKNSIVMEPLLGARTIQLKLDCCQRELARENQELQIARKLLRTFDVQFGQIDFENEVLLQKLDESSRRLETCRREGSDMEFNKRQAAAFRLLTLTQGIGQLEASTETSQTALSATLARSRSTINVEASLNHRYRVNQIVAAKDEKISKLESQISFTLGRTAALNSWVTGEMEQRGLPLEEAEFLNSRGKGI